MPTRPAVAQLPEPVRAELNARLAASGFSGYEGLAAWLTEQGFEIGKSSIHRYGQALERKLAAIKASTQAAQMIAEAAPDDEDSRSAAVISLVQTDLFDALLALQESEEADPGQRVKLLASAAKSIADVARASISNKRYASEVRGKLDTAMKALEAQAAHGKAGLDPETLRRVREEIYGIV